MYVTTTSKEKPTKTWLYKNLFVLLTGSYSSMLIHKHPNRMYSKLNIWITEV